MIAPKYRTDAQACSCPGYWYRRTCRHYRAYREAVALLQVQDAVNRAHSPIPASVRLNRRCTALSRNRVL